MFLRSKVVPLSSRAVRFDAGSNLTQSVSVICMSSHVPVCEVDAEDFPPLEQQQPELESKMRPGSVRGVTQHEAFEDTLEPQSTECSDGGLGVLQFVVKPEHDETLLVQSLSPSESEHDRSGLKSLSLEYPGQERSNQLWTSFTQEDSDIDTDYLDCSHAAETYSRLSAHTESQAVPARVEERYKLVEARVPTRGCVTCSSCSPFSHLSEQQKVTMKSVSEMSAFANIHEQLASIMEILTRSAVTEISKLVNDSSAVLQLEMCRRQNENEALRRKLEWMETELETQRRSSVCSRSVGVQAGRGLGGPQRDKVLCTSGPPERCSPLAESTCDSEWSGRLWGNGGPAAVEKDVSPVHSSTAARDECADLEGGQPEVLFVKQEKQDDNFEDTDSQGVLIITTEVAASGADPGEIPPFEHPHCEMERVSPDDHGTHLIPTPGSGKPKRLEDGQDQIGQRLSQAEFQHHAGGALGLSSTCSMRRDPWTVQDDSDTETDDPDFPYGTEQGLSDDLTAAEGSHVTMLPSRAVDVKPHFGMLSIVPKEEEAVVHSDCTGDAAAPGAAQSQLGGFRGRHHQVMREDLVHNSKHLQYQPVDSTPAIASVDSTQAQVTSIMEILCRTAAEEIGKLLEDRCAVLHVEVCHYRSENEALRRKVRAMERELRQAEESISCHLEHVHGKELSSSLWKEVPASDVHKNDGPKQSEALGQEFKDPGEKSPASLFIKEESHEEDSENSDPQGGLKITKATKTVAVTLERQRLPGPASPFECETCEEEYSVHVLPAANQEHIPRQNWLGHSDVELRELDMGTKTEQADELEVTRASQSGFEPNTGRRFSQAFLTIKEKCTNWPLCTETDCEREADKLDKGSPPAQHSQPSTGDQHSVPTRRAGSGLLTLEYFDAKSHVDLSSVAMNDTDRLNTERKNSMMREDLMMQSYQQHHSMEGHMTVTNGAVETKSRPVDAFVLCSKRLNMAKRVERHRKFSTSNGVACRRTCQNRSTVVNPRCYQRFVKMSNCINFRKQLGAIMEILTKAAVAEIIKLVDDGSACLRLEMCRAQNENEALKTKATVEYLFKLLQSAMPIAGTQPYCITLSAVVGSNQEVVDEKRSKNNFGTKVHISVWREKEHIMREEAGNLLPPVSVMEENMQQMRPPEDNGLPLPRTVAQNLVNLLKSHMVSQLRDHYHCFQ
ncbi:hypothetical protein Z043_117218, partial [Scleropages formosus]